MPYSVLVADDEPCILETTRYILESEGYDVLTARDGEEAYALAARRRPRVLLLDVMMPKLNGYEVCRRLRANPETAGAYILIVTAKGQMLDEQQALAAGADGYVRKPFDDEEVLARLERVPELAR